MEKEIKKVIDIWAIVLDEAPNLKGQTKSAMSDALLDLERLAEKAKNDKYDLGRKIQDSIRDINYELSELTKKANTTWKDMGILNMIKGHEDGT